MVPSNVKKAFSSSEKVFFEIDLTSPQYLLTIMKCQLLPNRQNLSTVLPPKILSKLRSHLGFVRTQIPLWVNVNQAKRGGNGDELFKDITRNWQRKRPIWLLFQLASLNEDNVRTSGVPSLDLYLFSKARQAGKKLGTIESPEERCSLNEVNSSQVNYQGIYLFVYLFVHLFISLLICLFAWLLSIHSSIGLLIFPHFL